MLFVLEMNIIIINYGIAVRDAIIGNENYGKDKRLHKRHLFYIKYNLVSD